MLVPAVHSGNMLRLLGVNHISFGLLRVPPPKEMCKETPSHQSPKEKTNALAQTNTQHIEKAAALVGVGMGVLPRASRKGNIG